jgi:hypothetical protein
MASEYRAAQEADLMHMLGRVNRASCRAYEVQKIIMDKRSHESYGPEAVGVGAEGCKPDLGNIGCSVDRLNNFQLGHWKQKDRMRAATCHDPRRARIQLGMQ